MLTNAASQGNNSRIGLGCDKIDSLYNPHTKNVVDVNNMLCLHCGKVGNLKKECPALKRSQKSFSKCFIHKNKKKNLVNIGTYRKRDLVNGGTCIRMDLVVLLVLN